MTKEEKITLIKYRLDRSNESLNAAQLMLENDLYIPAMDRIYYYDRPGFHNPGRTVDWEFQPELWA